MIVAIIVTYNVEDKITEVYKAIKGQVDRVIFVDNNSKKETINFIRYIKKNYLNVDIIFNDRNFGIAKALNQGIKLAKKYNPKYILTLDHDSIVENNMVNKMISKSLTINDEKIGIIVPRIFDINKNDYITESNAVDYELVREGIQSGALINYKVFEKIGFFNENLETYYVDTDFFYRAYINGIKMLQCNNITLFHEEGKKTFVNIFGKKFYYPNYSEYAVYYRARNYVYMKKKYGKIFSSKGRILKDSIRIIILDKRNIKFKILKIHIRGFLDGRKLWRNIKNREARND